MKQIFRNPLGVKHARERKQIGGYGPFFPDLLKRDLPGLSLLHSSKCAWYAARALSRILDTPGIRQINVTTDRQKQMNAARALSRILDTLGIRHANLGGFAVALYGDERRTKDIDIFFADIPATSKMS
ncbi:hypothetical protein MMC07_008399 [Pseudocyphellaria aurata]|nr:hypothetical protein [Pseudocyphellaria aurata]